MSELVVHDIHDVIKCGWRDEILVLYIVGKVETTHIDHLDRLVDEALAQSPSGKLALTSFVKPGVPIPSGKVRVHLLKFLRRRKLQAFGLVPTLPGRSLWIRLARRFIKLMVKLVRPPFEVKVSSSVEETLAQLETILRERSPSGTQLTRDELAKLIDEAAAALDTDLIDELRQSG